MQSNAHEAVHFDTSRCLSARLGATGWLCVLAVAATSCSSPGADEVGARPPVRSLAQALTDTDSDGMDDDWEIQHFGDLSQSSTDDFDADDMTNGEEYLYGFDPTVGDAFEDADGDRYPNIFEIGNGSDPNDPMIVPTPTFVVDGTGQGTHLTVSEAIDDVDALNGAYQIIGIAPGIYTGAANVSGVFLWSYQPKVLMIGLEGAARTIIDGGTTSFGWNVQNSAVISSLTFRRMKQSIYVYAPSSEVRLVDLLVTDNWQPLDTVGVYVEDVASVHVVGSTFLNNTGDPEAAEQIYINNGSATIVNTVVWGKTSGPMLAASPFGGASLTTHHCLVKGQTLSGTGNLAGSIDSKLRSDGRLRSDSPLRGSGGSVVQSRIDIDGELRPSLAPDIGVHQFNDSDADGLPDGWEVVKFGSTAVLSGTADEDNDGLSNAEEYDFETDLFNPDTDGDGVADAMEVSRGMDPLVADSDDLATDENHDGLIDSIGAQLNYSIDQSDADGDSLSNADESLMCTDPFRADTDGDGISDDLDAFPLDPLASSLVSDPQDVTAPIITLTAPWYAVAQ